MQHHDANAPVLAELPAPPPPAPPTSTPAEQLNEDELLAHKLQQMEVAEAEAHARVRSNSSVSNPSSQFTLTSSTASTLLGDSLQQPTTVRPHSFHASPSTSHDPNYFAHASQLQLSSNPNPANLAPEVVVSQAFPSGQTTPTNAYPFPTLPTLPSPHPTAHLPPAPEDPVELARYLEIHRQVPYPPQWALPPIVATFYQSFVFSRKTTWLDPLHSVFWRNVRFSENARNPVPPVFKLGFYARGGHFRDPRLTWVMTNPAAPTRSEQMRELWKYELRRDLTTYERKTETLRPGKGREILCTYVHAANYDSLNFIGTDGRRYKWVTHGPVSSVHGARYDTLRHALFVSTQRNGNQDPLYGQIVADHTYWDGFIDHKEVHTKVTCTGCAAFPLIGLRWKCKVCPSHESCDTCRLTQVGVKPTCKFTLVSLPDEALYIRSPTVDITIVIATLQIMKDWEKYSMQRQKSRDPAGFAFTEDMARANDLGRIRYFQASDFDGKLRAGDDGAWDDCHGTMIAALEGAKSAAESGGSQVGFGSEYSVGNGSSGGGSSSGGDSGGSSSSSSGGDSGGSSSSS